MTVKKHKKIDKDIKKQSAGEVSIPSIIPGAATATWWICCFNGWEEEILKDTGGGRRYGVGNNGRGFRWFPLEICKLRGCGHMHIIKTEKQELRAEDILMYCDFPHRIPSGNPL